MKIVTVILVILCVISSCAFADSNATVNLSDVISGKVCPLSVKLGDINSDWRVMEVATQQFNVDSIIKSVATMYAGAGMSDSFYTQGQTITISGATYLVGYKVDTKPLSLRDLDRMQGPPVQKLNSDTTLSLALLNMQAVSSISNIHPYDRNSVLNVAKSEEKYVSKSDSSQSQYNLKQLAIALQCRTSDYDDKLPSLNNPEEVKRALNQYARNKDIFVQPGTNEPYLPNPILSNHKMAHIVDPSEMVVFYESKPGADGTRNVAFLDSHVKRVSEEEWLKLKKISKIR